MTGSRCTRRGSSETARRSPLLVAFGRGAFALLVACSVAAAAGPARAETYTVTDCSAHSYFGTLGGGLTGSYDTIVFAVSCPTIQLCPANGCLGNTTFTIGSNLDIIGPGAASLAIVGGGDAPVFRIVGAGTTVSISGLTIRGGGISDLGLPGDLDPGGGIRNEGNLTLDSTVVTDNDGWNGGGIHNAGTLTVIDSTVSGNRAAADSYGGGIYSSGPVTIVGSTIADNQGASYGGGLFASGDLITIANSTFAGNSATYYGGAIWFPGPGSLPGGPAPPASTISNSTLTGNSAGAGAALHGEFPGGLTVTASILANAGSSLLNCYVNAVNPFPFRGAGTYNVVDDGSCAFSGAGNLNGTAAGLDPAGLQSNGGPTPTVNLTAGSAAIEKVTSAAACPAADQRGAARSVPCDAGAVEFETTVAGPTPVVASVQPRSGYVSGGLTGVVTGAGFTGATGVMVGGAAATDVVVTGDRSIAFTIPAAAAPGAVNVSVLGASGTPSAVNPTARYTYFPLPVPTTVPCTNGICQYGSVNVSLTATTECNVCNPAFQVQEAIGGPSDGFFVDTRCPSGWAYDPKQVKWNVAGLSGLSSITASVSVAMGADGKPLPQKFCYTDRPALVPVPGLARAASSMESTKGKSLRPCNKKKPVPPCIQESVPGAGEVAVTLLLPTEGEAAFIYGSKVPKLGKPKPAAGAVGSTVTVSGSGLTQVEAVVIGGVEAPIVARTKSKLTVTVPAGAQTGPVSVTGPFGVVTSKADFVVN